MNRQDLYEKNVNILLDAFNKGELVSGQCTGCAVGNLFYGSNCWTARMGLRSGHDRISPLQAVEIQDVSILAMPGMVLEAERLRKKVGYTWHELMQIEDAFEAGCHSVNTWTAEGDETGEIRVIAQSRMAGLTNVLDLLKEFHYVDEDTHTESIKKLQVVHDAVLV